jgi:hypothetical protein
VLGKADAGMTGRLRRGPERAGLRVGRRPSGAAPLLTRTWLFPAAYRIAYLRLSTDNVGREGFFLGALSATMANDRKLLVGGESLHQRLATGHHP